MSGHFTAWVAGMGPAAANHLWQSTACVAGAWLLTLALRRNQARVRYAVWVAGAAVVLLVWGTRWRAVRRIRREAKRVDEGREWEILRRVEGGASTRLGKGKYGDSGAALQNDDAQRDVRGIELRMSAERME